MENKYSLFTPLNIKEAELVESANLGMDKAIESISLGDDFRRFGIRWGEKYHKVGANDTSTKEAVWYQWNKVHGNNKVNLSDKAVIYSRQLREVLTLMKDMKEGPKDESWTNLIDDLGHKLMELEIRIHMLEYYK